MLRELGIVMGDATQAATVFEARIPNFLSVPYSTPSEYIRFCWAAYESHSEKNNNLNGKIFEYILATLCIREGFLPLYLSAKVAFVPNVIYDLMLYSKERGPICLSVKTSLRERYKQADLEAIALKYVHRKSLNYLITLDETAARAVKEKIKTGDVIGLDDVIVATSSDFDKLVADLKQYHFESPPPIEVITSNQIITGEKLRALGINYTSGH
jgi:hypothetical protein